MKKDNQAPPPGSCGTRKVGSENNIVEKQRRRLELFCRLRPSSTRAIPMPRSHLQRTESELQLLENEIAAEWRDLCMFYRVANGISERRLSIGVPQGNDGDVNGTNSALEIVVTLEEHNAEALAAPVLGESCASDRRRLTHHQHGVSLSPEESSSTAEQRCCNQQQQDEASSNEYLDEYVVDEESPRWSLSGYDNQQEQQGLLQFSILSNFQPPSTLGRRSSAPTNGTIFSASILRTQKADANEVVDEDECALQFSMELP
jgi:hypothetical protein